MDLGSLVPVSSHTPLHNLFLFLKTESDGWTPLKLKLLQFWIWVMDGIKSPILEKYPKVRLFKTMLRNFDYSRQWRADEIFE